jgi:CheY-like chemotaxis protein
MEPSTQPGAGQKRETIMHQTGSILIIDNDSAIADLLVESLTDEGYVVYSAPDGADALGAIACHPPALILLDVGHTGMRGVEVIEHVRQTFLATLPIVVMTTAPRCAAALLVSAALECLAKPFDLDDLFACVARYVQLPTAVPASCALRALAVAST